MQIGDVIDGKYALVRLIGHGGMGSVYEARHVRIGQRVALKFLHSRLGKNPEIVARFVREARAAAAVGSEHIIAINDIGEGPEGAPYLVMELVAGEDLASLIRRTGRLDAARTARIGAQVCRGLKAAHARGIIHRDLKPDNLMLTVREDGTEWVKILDFGVAKFRDALAAGGGQLTGADSFLGTPQYMAPEQFGEAAAVDWRADVYSVGVVLYELLTGTLPFDGRALGELMTRIRTAAAPPLATVRPDLSPELARIVSRAMARDREARFQTMDDLAAALRPFGGEVAPLEVLVTPTSAGPIETEAPTMLSLAGGPPSLPSRGPAPSVDAPPRRRAWLWVLGAALVGAGAAAAGVAAVVVFDLGGAPRGRVVGTRADAAAGAGPEGAAGTGTPRDGVDVEASLADPHPAPDCEPGKVPAGGACCWPGQTRSRDSTRCLGAPTCPDGLVSRGRHCTCPGGRVKTQATAGRCCWPRQAWSAAARRCVGTPDCPDHTFRRGEECVDLPSCPLGQVASAATAGRCCWPGQTSAPGATACAGPARCPVGFTAAGDACQPDAASPIGAKALACLGGSGPDCTNLGLDYHRGRDVPRDNRRAALLYDMACTRGEPLGCHNLGVMYENAQGFEQDFARAAALFKRSCDLGAALGCAGLGTAYHLGRGVVQDYGRAAMVYGQACLRNEPFACNNLGLLHAEGTGVVQSFTKAAENFRRSCDFGNGSACCALAVLHLRGLGVAADEGQARDLLRAACDREEPWACRWLEDPSSLGPPLQRLDLVASPTSVAGDAPVDENATCQLTVSPAFGCGHNCRLRLVCGDVVLYGAGPSGYADCRVTPRPGGAFDVEAHDEAATPVDTDPRIDLWTSAGRAAVADVEAGVEWEVSFELASPPPP
jgi:serine/threonine-protein kinase